MADDKLATVSASALVKPSFIEDSRAGTEDIGTDEIRLPRLAISQGLSPQLTPGDPKHIPGLTLFQLFNDLTGEIYGAGPIKFIPIRRDIRRIEFIPRDEGGGVRDLNVPANDPRNEWTEGPGGERVPPAATRYVEFIALILREGKSPEPIVISIKDTNKFNRDASVRLTTFIKMRQAAIYAGVYSVKVGTGKNDSGTFGIPIIENEGFVQDEAVYELASHFAKGLGTKKVSLEREAPEEGPTDKDVPF